MAQFTNVKNDFPNGWEEFNSSFDLLKTRLSENGFTIVGQKEITANEMVLDARPHSDIVTIERNGKVYTFYLDAERDLRGGREFVRDIQWLKIGHNSKPVKEIQFTVPPDRDVRPVYAAIEYWVRDLVNYVDGKPVERRKFNHEHWDRLRREEHARVKRETEARWNDYLKHPENYPGPPPRLVEPQLYKGDVCKVIPTTEPVGLRFALKYLGMDVPRFSKQ